MAEVDARDCVLAFESNKQEALQIAKRTAEKLQSGQVSLLEVVKAIGEYINDESDNVRTRAVSYLTAVISILPDNHLSRQQIQVLNQFLCARIEDGGAIEGLVRLQSLSRFSNDMAQDVTRTLFEQFTDLQQRAQSVRYKVYSLLNDLLTTHRRGIRDLGDESLIGTIRLVAGEKDPRNLMLVFSMLRVFMVEWDTSKHLDVLFDAVYAYFPITFRPPPNDPYGITAQDLKDRLRDCLASTGTLSPQTFPNLLDRLDSTSDVVKKDVLQALAACALHYDPGTISQYSITLWDAVKFEVLQAQEPFLADEALVVVGNIATCLSTSSETHAPTSDPLVQYLKPINKECLEHLQEPASRQAKASGDILKAAAGATIRSFEIVLQSIGPALLTLQQSSEGTVNQRAILTVINQLFEASIDVYGSWTTQSQKNPIGRENMLGDFKDKLLAIYSRALMGTVKEEVSYRLTAAKGLLLLSQMRSMLDENEVGLVVQHMNDIVLDEESYGRDELKQRCMSALADVAKFKPRLITDITFPKFIARLPDNEQQAAATKDYHSVLEGLAEISSNKEILETLMRRLLAKLDILLSSAEQSHYPYTCAILSSTLYVLDRSTKDETISLDVYYDRIVVALAKKAADDASAPLRNETVLDLLGRLMNLIVRHASAEHRRAVSQNVYLLFRANSTAEDRSLVLEPACCSLISTWLLAALPRAQTPSILQKSSIPSTISELATFAARQQSPTVRFSILRQIALYVNKHTPTLDLDSVDTVLTRLYSNVSESPDFNVRLIFTITKALVLRLAPRTNKYLTDLVSLLDSEDAFVSRSGALGFGTILSKDDILSKTNDVQIRLLSQQRVFQTLVPIFSARFRQPTDASTRFSRKETYLIALSGILGTVPSDIVMPELPTLLPLLLQSLDVSDQTVKVATLETLAVVITKNPDALHESGHVPALVKRLLSTSVVGKPKPDVSATKTTTTTTTGADKRASSTPQTRRLATECLASMPKHLGDKTPNPLLNLKKGVLQGLMTALDDPRRDVRKGAVDARAAWLRGVDDIKDDDDDE